MKLKLHYVEGSHDEVPGIHRHLETDKAVADRKAECILELGGTLYQQTFEVDAPAAYSELEVEAALCVWEWLCDITVNTETPNSRWTDYRENVGSVELRHESIRIGQWVLQVYDLLPTWYAESGAFDWEIVPAIVGELIPGEKYPDPQCAAIRLTHDDHTKASYARSVEWCLQNSYGITFEDIGISQDEFMNQWFDAKADPSEAVRRYAEKYDLEKVR